MVDGVPAPAVDEVPAPAEARLILVTGGARSGKSAFAQEEAQRLGGDGVSFIATAQALDAEMNERIAAHRAQRPREWQTLEEPLNVSAALRQARHEVVLLDCLALWVSNLLLRQPDPVERLEALIPHLEALLEAWRDTGKRLLVVTNEVGLGIVPENPLARRYRDLLGFANARLAREAGAVYLMVAGLPLRLK
ncbi:MULTISPECIES: bifunctional adenosylcobinamide kinase/adenosylcobinamide-phosphate guanylyltransferase [unclassified Meiothermus]|uniref:bifunctional adenosylcobinamide kinase/adenosylcobinamide-phosphate guanylyltransferase n=1 Tax=unclassified Meiothermus TaxID=370471 RepID=UPI000D7CC11F|nr:MULTISPECIES: bifunctional adenosylcobinamide kinase/adenosylcobinamide-phosphate guanylyltransferase [unclassified Meiothermus]PZA05954.1 bifunctional adenosylcobinamide kinase/adenosylcobinamide-phosphate guanylyltransferase [Meiothermus sp. Pnk-1]RYM36443.1 bifunctional adenosylcobinamide kinase/adenosylcobinamide-phosphate guanylyltransferase [Meiothermus sp. PNK-Is4]